MKVVLLNPFCLLLLFLLHHHLVASTDSICLSSNEYMNAMYRCRRNDFQTRSFCARRRSSNELSCNESRRIAVYSAYYVPNQDAECSQSAITNTGNSSSGHSDAGGNGECCILPPVENQCNNRQKCSLKINEMLQTLEDTRCSTMNTYDRRQHLSLTVVFICVTPKVMRGITKDSSNPDAFCDGTTEVEDGELLGGDRRQPIDVVGVMTTAGTVVVVRQSESTDGVGRTSPGGNGSVVVDDTSSVMEKSGGMIDWMWSLIFIRDNMDRFLIYLFLSIAIGVILVLLVVILGLCFGHSLRKRKSATSYDSHVTQSSTQTTDVKTSTIASGHTPGVEMVHYAPHSDSEYLQPITQSYGSNLAVPPGNSVHFASESAALLGSPPQSSFSSANGGASVQRMNMNVPQYRINTSMDSVDSGGGRGGGSGSGRMLENEDYRSNSLGRFYTNPYRHDSYRADGYRTLQHK